MKYEIDEKKLKEGANEIIKSYFNKIEQVLIEGVKEIKSKMENADLEERADFELGDFLWSDGRVTKMYEIIKGNYNFVSSDDRNKYDKTFSELIKDAKKEINNYKPKIFLEESK
jgi:ferritin-like protein